MSSTLTNLAGNKIVLADNSQYFYSIGPYELTNVLGNVVAVLREYNCTKYEDNSSQVSFKLYKTKEGNWYEICEPNSSAENSILRSLKTAIDLQENGSKKFTLPK